MLSSVLSGWFRLIPSATIQPALKNDLTNAIAEQISTLHPEQEKYPDTNLHSELANINQSMHSKTDVRKDKYILTCGAREIDYRQLQQDARAKFSRLMDYLQNSRQSEDKLAYSIIDLDVGEEARLERLKDFINTHPDNKLANWSLIVECGAKVDNCDISQENTAIATDPNNGALWLNIAILRAQNRDVEGTINALNHVVDAPLFNEYYGEHISLFEQALLSAGEENNTQTKVTAIGETSAIYSGSYTPIVNFCRKNSKNRADIAQLCVNTGMRMVEKGNTYLSNKLGFWFEYLVYQNLGNKAASNEIKQKIYEFEANENNQNRHKAQNLMSHDEILFNFWYNQLKVSGERASFDALIEEAVRLSKFKDYNPCP